VLVGPFAALRFGVEMMAHHPVAEVLAREADHVFARIWGGIGQREWASRGR
jgi:hypothetical protein